MRLIRGITFFLGYEKYSQAGVRNGRDITGHYRLDLRILLV